MISKELEQAIINCEARFKEPGFVVDEDFIDIYKTVANAVMITERDSARGYVTCKRVKGIIEQFCLDTFKMSVWDIEKLAQEKSIEIDIVNQYYDVLKMETYDTFESFVMYMERHRPWQKRFYQPRQCTLHIVVEDLQTLEDKPYKFQGISQPSRTGKSTICILFLLWVAMKRPNSHNAMGGHSGILTKGFYKELLNMMLSEEYAFKELFFYWHPEYADKPFPTDKSADDLTITLGDRDRFATITCRGIDGTWTGAVDVSADGYLYVDDLIRDREHSLSPSRMDTTYQEYLNKMIDRKNDGSKELMVGTLWNVLDPLERIRIKYANNPEYRFRKIPALNEKDESNFAYEINGFSTEYYREMRDRLDNAEWMAKYQQLPYVREGLLFPSDEMRYFDGTLEEEECKTWAVCDPAFGGADSLSMPVIKDYGNKKKKIIAWVHKKGTQAITVPKIVNSIHKYYITELHVEQNAGGKLLTDSIETEMKKRDIRHCKIVRYYASTKLKKEAKIQGYSDWIKENLLFLLPNSAYANETDEIFRYKRDEDYQAAMDELHMYTSEGKNPHDDAPDVLTQIAIVDSKKKKTTKIIESPI